MSADLRGTHLSIGKDPDRVSEALDLPVSSPGDPLSHDGRSLTRPIPGEIPKRNRRDLDVKVDSIEKWTRHLRSIALHVLGITSTPPRVVSKPATGARVHGSGQHETRGVPKGRASSGMTYDPILQGLPQRLENVPSILRELVQEQDALVRQADFSGSGDRPSSHEAGVTHRVVGSSKRPPHQKRAPGRHEPRDRMDLRDLDGLGHRRGDRMPGRRRASMVFPDPGGPNRSRL